MQKRKLLHFGIPIIDSMDFLKYEDYVAAIYKKQGNSVSLTKAYGDFGADVIARNKNHSLCIQAKLYNGKVGISAIQEVVFVRHYYNCTNPM